jgi:hypothetical protein
MKLLSPPSARQRGTSLKRRGRGVRRAQGNILPLALVIMTSILLAGIGLGIIILDNLRRAADTDASTVAYYAADGGLERQLYELRKLGTTVSSTQGLSGTYTNNSAWRAASSTYLQITSKVFATVRQNDVQFVDLYDPDNANASANVGSIRWNWSAGTNCAAQNGGNPPEMELGYARWLSGGAVLPQDYTVVRGVTPAGMVTNLTNTYGYRLRFRPKQCDASSLTVQAYTASGGAGSPMIFPGDVTIGSIGTYQKTTQAITVTMPRLDVLSGVFTFAVFSECQLVKDPNNPGSCP